MRPALIAVDLDGTFLDDEKTVPDTNMEAVHRANELDIPFVVCTGRPSRWLAVIRKIPGLFPLVVASNGAELYDMVGEKMRFVHHLNSELTVETIHALRARIPGITFGVETQCCFPCEVDAPIQQFTDWNAVPGDIFQMIELHQPIIKLLGFHHVLTSDELVRLAKGAVSSELALTHASMGEPFGLVEIAAAGINKATGLADVCSLLGIDSTAVAAFGDMPNDLEMLAWAGRGFVMENAHQLLHAAGFGRIGSNNDGSLGRKILELLA
ncbi:MAG: Cof-type HAD-IIB family hydrolase [Propionibacteriaceae bacterium]|nr:Cof-type HAD-IIB family hydrolase [Propionibacteriaceae bacterium]